MSNPATCGTGDTFAVGLSAESESLSLDSMPTPRRPAITPSKRAPAITPGRPRGYVPDNAFARLIHRRKEELDMTWYDIADRGGFASHTIVYALAKKDVHKNPPRQDTLKRIARALSLPLDVVKAAAAEACGYNLEEISVPLDAAEDVKIVVAAMTELSHDDREELRRRAIAFAEEIRADRTHKANGA